MGRVYVSRRRRQHVRDDRQQSSPGRPPRSVGQGARDGSGNPGQLGREAVLRSALHGQEGMGRRASRLQGEMGPDRRDSEGRIPDVDAAEGSEQNSRDARLSGGANSQANVESGAAQNRQLTVSYKARPSYARGHGGRVAPTN